MSSRFDVYRDVVTKDVSLYLVDLAAYGDLVTPEGYGNVYTVSGWTENVFTFIEHAETPNASIDVIEAFEAK